MAGSRSFRLPSAPRRSRTRHGSTRVPARVVASVVGGVLVVLNAVLVLVPVIGLIGAASAAGPVLDVPYASSTAVVVVGFVLAAGAVVLAFTSRHRRWVPWTFAALAWVISLVASVWPLVATADNAVDRVRDVLPWIVDLVDEVRGS